MNLYLLIAGIITIVVGLIHSVLGEILIFSKMRNHGVVPFDGGGALHERSLRIIWASWHVVSIFAWCIAAALIWYSGSYTDQSMPVFIKNVIVLSMLISSLLVMFATQAKHPGWIGLLIVSVLSYFA